MNIFRLFFASFLVCIASTNTHHLYAMDQQDDSIDMELVDPSELQDSFPSQTFEDATQQDDATPTTVDTVITTAPDETSIAADHLQSLHLDSSQATSTTDASDENKKINCKKNLIANCLSRVRMAQAQQPKAYSSNITTFDMETKKAIYLVALYNEFYQKEPLEYLREILKTRFQQTFDTKELIIYAREAVRFYLDWYGYHVYTISDDGSFIDNHQFHILTDMPASVLAKRQWIVDNEQNQVNGAQTTSSSSSNMLI